MNQCDQCRQRKNCEKDCGGCGGCNSCRGGGSVTLSLNQRQARLLMEFSQVPFLPLCRTAGAEGEELPLFLLKGGDTKEIPATAKTLQELAAMGLISLDDTIPLVGFDYAEYDALGETFPVLMRGSMALTPLGQVALEQIEAL